MDKLREALIIAKDIDDQLGMKMRADKCDIFATHTQQRKAAKTKPADYVGGKGCVETFGLLGQILG